MKLFTPAAIMFILLACKKEKNEIPRLSFTNEEKKWFTYQTGQQFKFKNDRGDSLVYTVTGMEHSNNTPEYKDTSYAIAAYTESYYAKLESANDSIIIYFYKELQYNNDPNKMKQTIRWFRMRNQSAKLAAIEYNASFTQKTINGRTYTTVTPLVPETDMIYPFTQFDKAYYDQGNGLIEIIDLNGVSWKRV